MVKDGPSDWNYFILNGLPILNAINGDQRRYFTAIGKPTKGIQLADEGDGDGMIVEIVATDAVIPHGDQVAMETSDDGDQIDAALYLGGVICGLFFGLIGTVGNGFGHDCPPVFVLKQEEDMVHQLDKLSNWAVERFSTACYSERQIVAA
jgi:hypothetical protein